MNRFTLVAAAMAMSVAMSVGCAATSEPSEDTAISESELSQHAAFELDYILMNADFRGKGGVTMMFGMTGNFDATLGYRLTIEELDGSVSTADFKLFSKPGDDRTRIAIISEATGTLKPGTMEVRGYRGEGATTYIVMSGNNGRLFGRRI